MQVQVGCRAIVTYDPVQGADVAATLLYPCAEPEAPVSFGPYVIDAAEDAAPLEGPFTTVVLSHGNGGTPWSHRGLACHLVRHGYAVLMVVHPGNNRLDNSLGSPSGRLRAVLLEHRPRHVALAFDAALMDERVGQTLRAEAYVMVGESIGAYTALAVAGGRPMTVPDEMSEAALRSASLAELSAVARPVHPPHDARLRAAVLFVPAIGFFLAEGSLRDVHIPLLVRTGGSDTLCSTDEVRQALRSLPDPSRLQLEEVPGAGHFSMQTPYPPALAAIPPAQDPPGFDRAAYQPTLFADVARFLGAAFR